MVKSLNPSAMIPSKVAVDPEPGSVIILIPFSAKTIFSPF